MMGKILILFTALITFAVNAPKLSYANNDGGVVGIYQGIKLSRLIVDVPNQGIVKFVINAQTKVNSRDNAYTIHKIPRHSVVRVIEKEGIASLVIVQEVPQ